MWRQGDEHDRCRAFLREFSVDGVEVIIEPQKFLGVPN